MKNVRSQEGLGPFMARNEILSASLGTSGWTLLAYWMVVDDDDEFMSYEGETPSSHKERGGGMDTRNWHDRAGGEESE